MAPLTIGLTGGIGSGKSAAAAELRRWGAEIVEGDELGRRVLEESPELLERIRLRFGADVFAPDGSLRRRELGRRVFADVDNARWLTDLTFPGIYQKWRQAAEQTVHEVIVFDAALIFEWRIASEFDLLVLVVADNDTAQRRIADGGRFTEAEFQARAAVQRANKNQIVEADCVIHNNGTLGELHSQVHQIWKTNIEPELIRRRKERHESPD